MLGKKSAYTGLVALLILFTSVVLNPSLKFKPSTNGPDVWEYQTVAVNYSEYNRFPVMGFIGTEEHYQLQKLKSNTVNDYLLCRFRNNGHVTYLAKPPAYVFMLGLTYKLFHPDMKYAYYLNLFFYAGILLFIALIGNSLHSGYGSLLGLAAAAIYACSPNHKVADILPGTMMTFVFCWITFQTIILLKAGSLKQFIMLGITIGIGLLTKGDITFVALLIPIYLLYFYYGSPKLMVKFVAFFAAIFIVLSPWIAYSNTLRIKNKTEFSEWKINIIKTENNCALDTTKNEEFDNRREIVKNNEHNKLVTHYYSRYANCEKPVIISNQVTDDEFLSVHNELNVDGHWHPEWRFRKENTYNREYTDKPVLLKILSFYVAQPVLFFKIALAKLLRATNSNFSFFLFAAFLFGVLLWFRKIKSPLRIVFLLMSFAGFIILLHYFPNVHTVYSTAFFLFGLLAYSLRKTQHLPFVFPLLILNSYLIIFIFYGDPRFTYVIEPPTIFSVLYFLHLFFQKNTFTVSGTNQE